MRLNRIPAWLHFTRTRLVLIGAAVALVVIGVLGARSIAAGAGGTIHGCAKKSGGAFRIASKCKKGEKGYTWNKQGAPGVPGAPGAQGPEGKQGPAGAPGPRGPSNAVAKVIPAGPQNVPASGNYTTLATFHPLAGASYAFIAKATILVRAGNQASSVLCRLNYSDQGIIDYAADSLLASNVVNPSERTIVLTGVYQAPVASPPDITLQCQSTPNVWGAYYIQIMGTRVDAVGYQ